MAIPTITTTVDPTLAPIQGIKIIVTVSPLPTSCDKVVSIDVDFRGPFLNGQHALFSKLVPAANTSTTFEFTVPVPANVDDPASVTFSSIIAGVTASFFCIGPNPSPING